MRWAHEFQRGVYFIPRLTFFPVTNIIYLILFSNLNILLRNKCIHLQVYLDFGLTILSLASMG